MYDLALHTAAGADAGGAESLFGLSLCAGAGGLDLGLALAEPGYRAVGYVERDAFAAAVLVARMEDQTLDHAPVWDDLTGFDGRKGFHLVGRLPPRCLERRECVKQGCKVLYSAALHY